MLSTIVLTLARVTGSPNKSIAKGYGPWPCTLKYTKSYQSQESSRVNRCLRRNHIKPLFHYYMQKSPPCLMTSLTMLPHGKASKRILLQRSKRMIIRLKWICQIILMIRTGQSGESVLSSHYNIWSIQI